jgi:hypothetical protein
MFPGATAKIQAGYMGQNQGVNKLQQKGKPSPMTDSVSRHWKAYFEWGSSSAAWEDRLSELADYPQSRAPTTPRNAAINQPNKSNP